MLTFEYLCRLCRILGVTAWGNVFFYIIHLADKWSFRKSSVALYLLFSSFLAENSKQSFDPTSFGYYLPKRKTEGYAHKVHALWVIKNATGGVAIFGCIHEQSNSLIWWPVPPGPRLHRWAANLWFATNPHKRFQN